MKRSPGVDERFVPLAAFVRASGAPVAVSERPVARTAPPTVAAESAPNTARGIIDFAHADLVGELSRLRVAAAEAFEATARAALRTLADVVLARELALAPADLDAIVAAALAEFAETEPVSLRVSAADAERVRATLPVRVDASLAAGDLAVDVRDGAIESTFAFRLEDALERARSRA